MHRVLIGIASTMALLLVPNASGQSGWNAPRVVISNCSGCHGIDGNTQLPYFPRLAGLSPAYAERKMNSFRESRAVPVDDVIVKSTPRLREADANAGSPEARTNMNGPAHGVRVEDVKAAVLWYAKQCPKPGRSGNDALIEQGRVLFVNGVPAQRVLPCASCHGPNAEGKNTAPRLAGQNAEYIEGQLLLFSKGDRRHAPEMTLESRDLNPAQAHAAAAYLQSR